MKVLEINCFSNGSTGRIACDTARKLEKEGHQCVVAYARGPVSKDIKTIKIGNRLSIYFHAFLTRVFDKHGFGSKLATKKLIKQIEEYDPDVIHLHNIHGYYINIEILFKYLKESKKKVVWTLHDCWSFTGHCSHFDSEGCNKWKTGCHNCSLKHEYPSSKLYDSSKRNYIKKKEIFNSLDSEQVTIVTPSNWLANLVKKSFLSKYKVEVIYNGIDLNVFKPTLSDIKEKHGIEDKKVILGVASVWTKKKGFYDFIELSKILDDKYKIVMIGLSDKQLKEVPSNVLGIKRTESIEELVKWYSASHVFFNPTYEDTYPTVNLESQACGTSAVTYDTGGSVENCCIENVIGKRDYDKLKELLHSENIKIFKEVTDKGETEKKYIELMKGEYK